MKKSGFVIIIIALCILTMSCGYTVVNTYSIEDYSKTFKKAFEYTIFDKPTVMCPKVSTGCGEIVRYSAKCVEEMPLGESVQILLSVKYEEEDYEDELERIAAAGKAEKVLYDTERFNFPAYVSSAGYLNLCEYVLTDSDNFTLHYVLLQSAKQDDIIFDNVYLPKEYKDYTTLDETRFSIYEELVEIVNND